MLPLNPIDDDELATYAPLEDERIPYSEMASLCTASHLDELLSGERLPLAPPVSYSKAWTGRKLVSILYCCSDSTM